MLSQLSINDFAIIKNADIEFCDKLNVITGETGAGKSIIVDALSLALGYRAKKESIRQNAEKTTVQAVFDIDEASAACRIARQMGIDVQNQLILSRQVFANGKNICRVNSTIVTIQDLKTLGSVLVDIHGQHEHQCLFDVSAHIKFLDKYDDKISDILKEVQTAYTEYIKTKKELDELISYSKDIEKEKEKLNYDISQIQSANLKKGEDLEIEKKIIKLKNHALIYDNVEKAYELIYKSDKSVFQNLQNSSLYLNKAQTADASLCVYSEKLDGVIAGVEDIYLSLRDYMAEGDYENISIDELEERAYLITQLKRRYGESIDEVLALKDDMINKLSKLSNLDFEIENKSKEEKQKKAEYFQKADVLSNIRHQEKSLLEENIIKQLQELSMPDAVFVADIKRAQGAREIRKDGYDEVEFLFSSNKGYEPRPISKIASGGEMSRLMLAIKILVADNEIKTLIFDEIDTGISGRTAQITANKLKKLSGNYQVLLITHLPQIASAADVHFSARKRNDEEITVTELVVLGYEERIAEIAKMVGGVSITQNALDHAKQMLDMAKDIS